MKANTRLFGEIEVSEDKIITVEQGIIGFPEMKRFTLIFDVEKRERTRLCGCSPWTTDVLLCRL